MIGKFLYVKIWVWGSFLGPKQVMDEFMRFSNLGDVYLCYIREKRYL